ncbi:2-C-methyl-D-erythritol 4-phosphate cytidylyltransferase [Geosporobacter ferrireducens]|uniref:2-C-methyl-D-erythritol 4-phosphate cytidylyltransferase n=1 Tax=Geosporobacter ferrireducens TaxID=1424294 RepID=A0A1D8GJN2_9FIRM|nr:2-C-methyl-D-erythritol 4-phosphate cytidylyltransferase [Geosporobacter ferrireducens]AOT71128.1 2-C-methyl-D-erythritol 4-phosphate cytidylyltransferase [Geosporobacter ferrireducens]MTI57936.1 2-C-methyl-D-erythritol 4-phosphate cytidylyltransferase [Geosporobacter ferrireducens]
MNSAIILAAGKGSRMKAELNKQYLVLKDKPIIAHTITVFENCPLIDEIILVINPEEEEICKKRILDRFKYKKITKLIGGGAERQRSVHNGLNVVDPRSQIVLVHDGARPLVTSKIIERCVKGAQAFGAVSAGVPIKETIKIMTKDRFVQYTPKREDVWITQTPQAFQLEIIKKAHDFAILHEILGTDDAMLVEHMGEKVRMVEGDYENIKITTPEDLIAAEAILGYKRRL